ncbi:hypothetical protein [Paraburkholderia haematera]|uniref:Lysozyme inhibitor LprI N-terminal domain-containing protein n=1 Tax=Paraburkholderia haematera TaxID=2793077 RepID=A0ABN7L2E8_9BURK|nr:hypothetical protein [Paraburkholderia haematera]CAE6721466.1 hypothetical protein R69888_01624 [Paraburkholderia haematera]
MNKNRFCHHALLAWAPTLMLLSSLLLLGQPRPALASEDSANASAEVAGQRARFDQELCGESAQDVANYKEKLRNVLTEASQFDTRWQAGWQRGNSDVTQMRSLRLNSPSEFAARLKGNCDRIKWQADNLLRARPQK